MKIVEIHKNFHITGGADRHYIEVMKLFESAGHTVIPFSTHSPYNLETKYEKYFVARVDWKKSPIRNLKNIPKFFYSKEAEKKLELLIDKTSPDIAHAHNIYHDISASVLSLLKRRGIPVVLTIHDWKLLCPNYKLFTEGAVCERCIGGTYFNAIRHNCLGSFPANTAAAAEAYIGESRGWYKDNISHLIAPSAFVKQKFVEFGWNAKKIWHIPHFLPSDSGVISQKTKTRIDTIIPRENFAIAVSRLSPEKGIDFLIKTWVEEKIAYKLIIVGSGPSKQELREYIKQSLDAEQ